MSNHVLYVEDNTADIQLLQYAFRVEGILNPLDIAETVEEAMDYLRTETPPLLVILDLALHGRDGLEVLRAMRESGGLQYVPVVVLTVSDDEETKIKSFHFGAQAFQKKPLHLERLIVATRQLNLGWEIKVKDKGEGT